MITKKMQYETQFEVVYGLIGFRYLLKPMSGFFATVFSMQVCTPEDPYTRTPVDL